MSQGRPMTHWGDAQDLVDTLRTYSQARQALLKAINCRPHSMRDPLAEFSEVLVAKLTGERLADSPTQKGWDLMAEDGTTTQVRYVANPAGRWVNEHIVAFDPGVDRYALVVFEALEPTTVVIFGRDTIRQVYDRLGKRHAKADTTLNVSRAVIQRLQAERDEFEALGVVFFPVGVTGVVKPAVVHDDGRAASVPHVTAASGIPPVSAVDATGTFQDDDPGYLAWLDSHPNGYVLNCLRSLTKSGLRLHRASCRTIAGTPSRGGPWTGTYIKVCSDSASALRAWSTQHIGLDPPPCGTCRPSTGE